MGQIPTAEEIFKITFNTNHCHIDYDKAGLYTIKQAMIEFAKLHVKEALKFAATEATVETINKYSPEEQHEVNQDSILNSYFIENIK